MPWQNVRKQNTARTQQDPKLPAQQTTHHVSCQTRLSQHSIQCKFLASPQPIPSIATWPSRSATICYTYMLNNACRLQISGDSFAALLSPSNPTLSTLHDACASRILELFWPGRARRLALAENYSRPGLDHIQDKTRDCQLSGHCFTSILYQFLKKPGIYGAVILCSFFNLL